MTLRPEAIERTQAEWVAAYKAANPTNELPEITYERGWFVLRYRRNGGFPNRLRRAELERATSVLRARVASLSAEDPAHG